MKFVCSLIVVEDIKQSRNFYENILGQKVKYDFGEDIVFEGDFTIHLESHLKRLLGIEVTKQSNNFELYFETDRLEEAFLKLKNEKVTFIHEILEQPWGQRVMRFYDLDFHMIEIGETMESVVARLYKMGLTIEEICKKSSMPVDFVEKTVNSCK
ncbi:MAG TPA: VOC family protein [Spirochaetia bacterium]|nr:VOC family protein [Spirochaetia bacterium]